MNGKMWHSLLLYGEPQVEHMSDLWDALYQLLHQYTDYVIIGDINQVDNYSDKLGGGGRLNWTLGRDNQLET